MSRDVQDEYVREMVSKQTMPRYCDNHWKVKYLPMEQGVTVDESIREIERSEDEEESEDDKSNICQLLKPMDGVSAQRQVLRALTLEV